MKWVVVFAIAFATDLCHGHDPVVVTYNQEKMHGHLLTCFEMRELSLFPRAEKTKKINARMMKVIPIFCSCKLPEAFNTNMVECEVCLQWHHYKCVGMTSKTLCFRYHMVCGPVWSVF